MGIMVYSLLWVMQGLYHQQYHSLGFGGLGKGSRPPDSAASGAGGFVLPEYGRGRMLSTRFILKFRAQLVWGTEGCPGLSSNRSIPKP